jgi:uncharacterized membrane protein
MRNRARIGGHPIHPMLVTIPVAALPVSLVFDIVYLLSDNPFWYAMAFWLMIVGIAGGLAAGIPGLIDYLTSVPAAAMPTARRHGLLNAGILVWFIIDVVVRATGPMIGPRVGVAMLMSLIGVGALGYAGWLGGSLVFKHRVGVDEPVAAITPAAEQPEVTERRVA